MRTDRLHPALVEEDDLVQPLHRRNAVGDQQGGLPCPAGVQIFENDLLGAGIDGRHRVIQNQDGCILEQSACDGDALLLAARDGHAALAQHRLVAILEVHDVIPHIGQTCSPVDLLRCGVVHTEPDVVGDGIREEEIVLRNVGTGVAHRVDGDGVDVLAVHKQGAVRHIVGAEQQIDQSRLARAGLAHDADALAGLDGKGDVLEHIVLAVRVAEGQITEFNAALDVFKVGHARAVGHVDGRIQQLADPVEGGLAAGGLFDQHGDSHDGPDNGLKIADVLHQLAGIEPPLIDQIAAVAEDDADDRLDKEGHQNLQQGGDLGIGHIDLFVLLVQLPEGYQLLQFLDKGLDDRNAGEVLLREIRQVGKRLLPFFPAFGHHLAHDGADGEHHRRRDQGQQGQGVIHPPHIIKGEQTQRQRVEEHQHAVAEALLNGVEVVGVQAHQVADLVHLIVLVRELAAVVEHLLAQIRHHPDGRTEKADAPQEAANDHDDDDPDHRQTDLLEQYLFGKGHGLAVHDHLPQIHAVDDQAVQLRDLELDEVHRQQRQQTQQQRGGIFEVIAVDILAEYHSVFPLLFLFKKRSETSMEF